MEKFQAGLLKFFALQVAPEPLGYVITAGTLGIDRGHQSSHGSSGHEVNGDLLPIQGAENPQMG
jgi:hypothetical protein